jgi:branched-chain amino acid transport system substrate-binding protein
MSTSFLKPSVIALLLVFLAIGGVIGYAAHPAPPAASTPVTMLPSVIPIGVLLTVTGDFSSYGVRAQATAKIAESEINNYTSTLGLPVTFQFYYEDYETQPDVALTKVQALYAQGIKVIIGGMTSGAMKTIDSYVDTNHILVIDGTSTAARESVAPPGDYEVRVVPAAEAEGAALTAALLNKGYTNVAMVSAEDAYSLSIHDAFKSAFTAAGGNLVADVTYSYPGTTDFTVVLNTLEQQVAPLMSSKQPVAIFANMWEDVAVMLNQANSRNSPLLSLTWFGPDTMSQDTVISKDAGAVASKVKLISVQLAAPITTRSQRLNATLMAQMGQAPDVYALATYDAAWIAALAILQAGRYDADAVKAALPTVAATYWGATGNTELNSAGDRVTMDMEFWAVVQGQWERVATYSSTSKQVTWLTQL